MGETREGPPGRCRALARGAKDVAFLALGAFPTPSQLITIGNDPAPPATLTPPSPQHGVKISLFCFSILNFFPALAEVSRETHSHQHQGRSVSQQGISTRSKRSPPKHACLRLLGAKGKNESEEGHNWPGPGHRQSIGPGGSAPEVGDPNREGARAPPERVLDSGRGGARALEEKTPQPPKAHR